MARSWLAVILGRVAVLLCTCSTPGLHESGLPVRPASTDGAVFLPIVRSSTSATTTPTVSITVPVGADVPDEQIYSTDFPEPAAGYGLYDTGSGSMLAATGDGGLSWQSVARFGLSVPDEGERPRVLRRTRRLRMG